MSFFDSLKQRKIFQWAVAYLAGAWVLVQLIDVLGARWGVSESAARIIDIVLIVGFFVTLVVAWYHGDQGKQRVSGPELLIIAGLLAVGGLALGVLNLGTEQSSQADSPAALPVASDEEPWIAILPFKVQTEDPELENFAGGLTEDISNGLSDFSYLLVISRNSTANLASESVDIRQMGKELGARYVLQGALRKAGSTTRITVQLVDAQNGTQIWTETFDRELTSAGMLAIQDELTDRIVATVADPAGVVVRTLAAPADRKAPEDLTPYEAVLRYFLFQQRISAEDHLITRAALERAVELDPGFADAWTSLSLIYQQEFMNNLNPQPDSLERALGAAQRAVDLDPASSRAQFAIAQARYFLRDVGSFLVHAERAIELNPRNTDTMAMVGIMMGYSGDWERSVELTTNAMSLNPQHAGWYYFNTFFNEYRQYRYAEALTIAQKINMPDYWASPMVLAITHAQLGDEVAAEKAAEHLRRIWPTVEEDYYQMGLVNWMYAQPELIEHVNEGLRKAGINLRVPEPAVR
jgi:TolB-like protein/Tfp pilus assembly protein PilF